MAKCNYEIKYNKKNCASPNYSNTIPDKKNKVHTAEPKTTRVLENRDNQKISLKYNYQHYITNRPKFNNSSMHNNKRYKF